MSFSLTPKLRNCFSSASFQSRHFFSSLALLYDAPKPFALYVKFGEVYASPSSFTRACAAARRAIGTRNGEQET